MDWGALRHRLSCDRGWTPREIDELTVGEALECLEFALRRSKNIIAAPREAREIVAAARERRRAWIEAELRRCAGTDVGDDRLCEWERLAVMSADLSRESVHHEDDRPANDTVADSRRDVDWLKRIHDELRLLRQAVVAPVGRGLWSE
jgi:hypothetical protein